MGNAATEVDERALVQQTSFSPEEIADLIQEFKRVSPRLKPIKERKFKKLCVRMAAKYPNPAYSDPKSQQLIFNYSDASGDKRVDVSEVISALSIMVTGTPEAKARLVFRSFDKNGDGNLTREELASGFKLAFDHVNKIIETSYWEIESKMQKQLVAQGKTASHVTVSYAIRNFGFDVSRLSKTSIDYIVERFFQEVDQDGSATISEEEFVGAARSVGAMTVLLNPGSEEAKRYVEESLPPEARELIQRIHQME